MKVMFLYLSFMQLSKFNKTLNKDQLYPFTIIKKQASNGFAIYSRAKF